jgi:hypothetical protein
MGYSWKAVENEIGSSVILLNLGFQSQLPPNLWDLLETHKKRGRFQTIGWIRITKRGWECQTKRKLLEFKFWVFDSSKMGSSLLLTVIL